MSGPDLSIQFSGQEALHLVELAETAVAAQSLPELADSILPGLTKIMHSPAALLYLKDPPLHLSPLFISGLPTPSAPTLEKLLAQELNQLEGHSRVKRVPVSLPAQDLTLLALFPLKNQHRYLGLLGLVLPEDEDAKEAFLVKKFVPLFSHILSNLVGRLEYEKQIADLNTYLSVSTMITQALDLRDVLEGILYFCMEALTAEAASVLLLDYTKENFRFYSAEGPTKPVLLTASFPADQGLAGSVMQTLQSEVINDVQHDPRFYGKFDSESGFVTRNMIVIPLVAGEERIGVLEVLNKTGDEPFYEEERLLLHSISEEIAFAIRNAKLFEVVVKSYCKQRQGMNTCKGCKRPLGSWTPCVKYREEAGLLT